MVGGGVYAQFGYDNTTVCEGGAVNFTDQSTGSITSWNWSFPGGIPSSATGAGPHTITNNTEGTYDVSLQISNGITNHTEIKTGYINVINCTCGNIYYSNLSDDYISNVIFSTINNPSGSTNYSDFTSISTDVGLGQDYNLQVEVTVNGNWVQHAWAWFDWNRDCDFDDAVEAFDLGPTPGTTGVHTLSANITIPAGATLGSTVMRIAEHYYSDPNSCKSSNYGKGEDYSINITGGVAPPSCTTPVGPPDGTVDVSTWHTVRTYARSIDFNNNQFYTTQFSILEPNYNFPTNMKIRFMCNASGNRDDVYIDEIFISGLFVENPNNYLDLIDVVDEIIIPQDESLAELVLYPNPVSGSLVTVKSDEPVHRIFVYDVIGNLILFYEGLEVLHYELDISRFNPGMYIIRVETEEDTRIVKLIRR